MKNPNSKYAWCVKAGEKGQFVIPKEAGDIFEIKPGDFLIVLGDEKRGIAIPAKNTMAKYISLILGENMPGPEEREEDL